MRILLCLVALAVVGCESAPIQVDSARAVVVQNETTKKHIQDFSESNKKAQVHVKKVKEEAIEEATAIDTARKYLEELLGE